jgi:hypothetical protein
VTQAVPEVLQGTLETMSFGRRAGEWELDLGPTQAPLSELVAQFTRAFGWVSVRTFEAEYHDRSLPWPGEHLPLWLSATADDAAGFHATLDLSLFWEDGEVHETVLPDSGKLWFERDTEGLTLTLWPNLFTDRLPLYTREGTHSFSSRAVEWPRAAQRNRERLAASLRAWETASGGEIVAWGSELVAGVERYGFAASATPV